MDGVDKIKERILEEAQEDANRIIDEAREKADGLKKEKFDQADSKKEKFSEEIMKKVLELKNRMLTVAQLDMRKDILSVKQELIDAAFNEIYDVFRNLSREEYQRLITEMLMEANLQGDEEIIFSVGDVDKLDQAFIDNINSMLNDQGKMGNLKMYDERGNFRGGFIVKSQNILYNYSFESILRIIRDDIEPQVADLLFSFES